jgi:hypothetical protein
MDQEKISAGKTASCRHPSCFLFQVDKKPAPMVDRAKKYIFKIFYMICLKFIFQPKPCFSDLFQIIVLNFSVHNERERQAFVSDARAFLSALRSFYLPLSGVFFLGMAAAF